MFKKYTFRGGVHPSHNKSRTEKIPIEIFPAPEKVIIPLSQHIGVPAKPAVKRGDYVSIGQVIGEAAGFVSVPVHASVSGNVLSVAPFAHPSGKQVIAVEIENDGKDEKAAFRGAGMQWHELAPGELVQMVQAAGITGMGGASFPAHVKLSPPSNKPIDTLIINGAECEPYLTADHCLMLERTDDLLVGVQILKKILNAKHCYIGIENNKPSAITAVKNAIKDNHYDDIKLVVLKTKYPQGGEKQLINAITGRCVPSGGLPMDCGCVVQNVGTTIAIRDAIVEGIPVYRRVVTVTGPTVSSPKNYLVRIGTLMSELLEACGANMEATKKVLMGGPMMGIAQTQTDVPVIKSTSGILAYDKLTPAVRENPCINCGRCIKTCPINLVPSRLAKLVEREKFDEAVKWNLMDCMECGSCTYACPSKINLIHFMKLGKFHVQAQRALADSKKQ